MTKHYCDKCGAEITSSGRGNNPDKEGFITIGSGRFNFRVLTNVQIKNPEDYEYESTAIKNIHICFYCRLDALNAIDDRPVSAN